MGLVMNELIKMTDGIVSRYINRKISTRITMFIVKKRINITPNQVSVLSFAIGIISALIYLFNNPLLAGIGVQASSIIDGVDGELARILKKTTRFGAFFDAILDRLVNIVIIICISLYLSNLGVNQELLLVSSICALSGDLMVSYIHARGEASLNIHPIKIGIGLNYASRDVRLFTIFMGSVLENFIEGVLLYTLVIIALLSYSYVILKIIDAYRYSGEINSRT